MTWTKRSTDGIYTFEHDGQQVDVMMNGRTRNPAVVASLIHAALIALEEAGGDPNLVAVLGRPNPLYADEVAP